MLRKMAVAGLMLAVVCAVAGNSFAGATGKSFKVSTDGGVDAGLAFDKDGKTLLVHVPGADVKGTYAEGAPILGVITIVNGSSISKTYIGSFTGVVFDLGIPLLGKATIQGVGVGSTGIYTFKGQAK